MTAAAELAAQRGEPAAPLMPELAAGDLLHDLARLNRLLETFVDQGAVLDSYLAAAGMLQVVEDWLGEPPVGLDYALGVASGVAPPLAHGAQRALRMWTAGRRTLAGRAVSRWRFDLARLVEGLSDGVISGSVPANAWELARAVVAGAGRLPNRLHRRRMRLPAAFARFDLTPEDLQQLAAAFAARTPLKDRPLAVLGVRTSGAYTAPLQAACLRALGYQAVALSHRPGLPWPHAVSRRLRAMAEQGGFALISDDPPKSGGSVLSVAADLEGLGFPAGRVYMTLPLAAESEGLPERMARYPAVSLPHAEWAINRRLQSGAVEADLRTLAGPEIGVTVLARLGVSNGGREHVRARYRVMFGGRECVIAAEGIGLGWFGSHSAAVARRLAAHLPPTFGIRDGVLYRAWLPDGRRAGSAGPAEIAGYVADRARELATDSDAAQGLGRRGSAWKSAGDLLAGGFGRAMPPARPLTQSAARRLLETSRPSVVDGRTGPMHWFRGDDGRLLKVDADRGAFAAADLHCYDAAFDLAGAAAGREPEFGRTLRLAYQERTGTEIDAERWLLYRLLHLQTSLGTGPVAPGSERPLSVALQEYFAETVFADTATPEQGPLCAIDVDGVLETPGLGFAALTPASAMGLRALARHGYRVLLATGRTGQEVRDRCRAYPVFGGVAEYGALLVIGTSEALSGQVTPAQIDAVARLRLAALAAGCRVDADRRASLRAAGADDRGRLRPLELEVVQKLAASVPAVELETFAGARQTDLVPAGIDKGRAVVELLAHLGETNPRPLAFAVGDDTPDLTMLSLARLPLLTATASPAVRRAGYRVVAAPCQRGFAQAVGQLLGHDPGGCPACRPPRLSPRTRLMLECLAAPEWPGWRKAIPALRTAYAYGRLRLPGGGVRFVPATGS